MHTSFDGGKKFIDSSSQPQPEALNFDELKVNLHQSSLLEHHYSSQTGLKELNDDVEDGTGFEG